MGYSINGEGTVKRRERALIFQLTSIKKGRKLEKTNENKMGWMLTFRTLSHRTHLSVEEH